MNRKPVTFIDVLNNPEGRAIVEQIEDVQSSLRMYPEGDPTLEAIQGNLIDELYRVTGYRYVLG